MEKMMAFCGLTCSECPTFIATQKDDDRERKKVAKLWSKEYKSEIKPEDINCDGCLTGEGGQVFSHSKVCEIRKCGQEKGIKNCAYCYDFACDKLNDFFKMAPEAKTALAEIRKNL